MDSQGNVMATRHQLIKEGISYYSNLFKLKETSIQHKWFPRVVSFDMNLWLARLPLEEEVNTIVFSLVADKASGPNGYMTVFFQWFWGLLNDFFKTRGSLWHINSTLVTLILKTPKALISVSIGLSLV